MILTIITHKSWLIWQRNIQYQPHHITAFSHANCFWKAHAHRFGLSQSPTEKTSLSVVRKRGVTSISAHTLQLHRKPIVLNSMLHVPRRDPSSLVSTYMYALFNSMFINSKVYVENTTCLTV